jgi:hypothetical protein
MTCPLFVELCAGTAAVSLRLHRDGARPPVSRMGSKAGYADTILRVLGLIPGQRAERYLWCEPDPGVRLLLEAYRDATLAREAAAIIRSWAAEDPRALWERLRAEGPPRLPDGGAEAGEVARWLAIWGWHYRQGDWSSGGPVLPGDRRQDTTATATATATAKAGLDVPATVRPDARDVDPREVARWAAFTVRTMPQAQARGATAGDFLPRIAPSGVVRYQIDAPATGLLDLPGGLPAAITPDAREVDPREVARWVVRAGWAFEQGNIRTGFAGPGGTSGDGRPGCAERAQRFEDLATLPAAITPDAREVDPGPALPPGTVAYMDPPYVGTTGYASDLPRADVVALARRWAAAGAVVAISEAEPIPELVAEGWHAVRIDGERVGQKRTFSKQQAEWLTINRPPAWRPSVQGGLFAPR